MGKIVKKSRTAHWFIRNFDRKIKDEFMGLCKMEGKKWRQVLTHMLRAYNIDRKHDL